MQQSSLPNSTINATTRACACHTPLHTQIMPSNTKNPSIHSTSSADYLARSQWLRAAVLGANDGLVSVSSLMIGVGAINQSARVMLASGLAGLVAGACSMAIGEFVSVYTQYDIESALPERKKDSLPSPWKAAGASGISFAIGALMPLLAGGFVGLWAMRVAVVAAVSSMGLAAFGAVGAILGGAAAWKAATRVLVGGWIAMLMAFGVLRLFGLFFNVDVSSAA